MTIFIGGVGFFSCHVVGQEEYELKHYRLDKSEPL